MSYFARIKDALTRHPDLRAIEDGQIWYSWSMVDTIASQLDAVLTEAGLGTGSPVGLVARNRMPHIASLYGLLATGRTTVMIYSAFTPAALAKELEKLKLPAILADSEDWTEETLTVCRTTGAIALQPTKDPACPIKIVAEGNRAMRGKQREVTPGVAIEMLSSGTTGVPKRIPISWRTLELTAEDAAINFRETGLGMGKDGQASPLVQPAPLANIGGLYAVVTAGIQGWPLALLDKFGVDQWLSAVKRVEPQVSWLAPAAISAIWDAGVSAGDLGSLVGLRTGSAALSPRLQDAFEDKYGLSILLAYGATEFCGVVVLWTLADHAIYAKSKRGSAGRARPGVKLRVRDAESGAALNAGEVGILDLRVDRIGGDWIATTDLASIDSDGFLFLHGRADDAINRGGFKIMPVPVIDAISKHSAVLEATVVGMKDDRLGEVPVAVLALRDGYNLEDGEMKTFLRDQLLAYQIPVEFRIVHRLPRNPSLKVDREAVLAMFANAKLATS
ncbi:class I adenylate-forming enzyme family protein [Sphingomonas paeninsulae]|uniref:class I adenylate-forming enzyme family protein n=1 Tax=Sphingomonas paeninsulae TaxID=2319844 RepID=UPI0013CED08B|nr:class I adenylate-forming enzyme family protein [Sphingomonas paeninsulae]